MAGDSNSAVGSGGMITKLLAARMACLNGEHVVIAKGSKRGVLTAILAGKDEGTLFPAPITPREQRMRWMPFSESNKSELLIKAAAMVGRTDAVNAVTLTGELVMWRNVIDALLKQMIEESYDYGTGYLNYSERGAITLRAIGPTVYTRMRDIVQRVCTSGLIYLNSNAADFKNEDMLPYLERFMRGSGKASAQSRSKVMKLLWDCVSSEFGARNELYERNYLGDMDSVHQGPLFEARASGNTKVFEDFVDKCMSEYDLDGWKLPGFFNGEDVRHFDKL